MTSRTTPVGIIVLALAGLFAMGCSAQTSAVFEALLDPARALASPSEPDSPADDAVEDSTSATWWPHPDGYAMVLPPGWSGVAVEGAQTSQLVEAIEATEPELAARIVAILSGTGARVSAIAGDPTATGDLTPILVVLAQPTEGKRPHVVRSRIRDQISDLPGLTGGPYPHDAQLPTAKGVSFDFTIDDPDLGELRVRSYLFRFGSQAYLFNFVASEDVADDAQAMFDAIAESLRFGI